MGVRLPDSTLELWKAKYMGKRAVTLDSYREKHGLHSVGERGALYDNDRRSQAMRTGLERIAHKVKTDTNYYFTSLAHHLAPSVLANSLKTTRLNRGVDQEAVQDARATQLKWEGELISQIHTRRYPPPPVRCVHIPKPGEEKKRAIGVLTVWSQILPRFITRLLDPN